MSTHQQQVEEVRTEILKALRPLTHVQSAAMIHGLTLVLAQAMVLLRAPGATREEALEPVSQLLSESVDEWWNTPSGGGEILH